MKTGPKTRNFHETRRGLRWWAAGLIGLCGAYQIGLGIYFIALRPPLLPEDLRFVSFGPEALKAALPRLGSWLHLVFTVLGGQMAAVGALVVAVALHLGRDDAGNERQLVPLGIAGALSVGLMSAVNWALGSDSRWLLTLPAGIWAVGLLLAVLSHSRARTAESTKEKYAG